MTGYTLLAINAGAALRGGWLVGDHSCLFDRVIAAQALSQDIPVLSPDSRLDRLAVQRIW